MKQAVSLCAVLAAAGVASAQPLVYGVTNGTLISWKANAPGMILSGQAIGGLASNETVRGIDFRPATGQLFALGSFNNLYTLNVSTGAVTLVGAGNFTPGLNGAAFGFDFNPTIDRIRVVSDADQNLVLNPNDGTATGATPLFYNAGDPNFGKDPNVVGSAYTNSFAGATTTQLFGIDTGLDVLVKQANSAGTLDTVGSLGANITTLVGFDIFGANNVAYAASQDIGGAASTFWKINLNTGAATAIGEIGGGILVTATAVVPTPGAAAMLGIGGLLMARRRR